MVRHTLLASCGCELSGCLAWIAFIKVSTSVAKFVLPTTGSEREYSSSVPYAVEWYDGVDWRGEAVADFEMCLSTEKELCVP